MPLSSQRTSELSSPSHPSTSLWAVSTPVAHLGPHRLMSVSPRRWRQRASNSFGVWAPKIPQTRKGDAAHCSPGQGEWTRAPGFRTSTRTTTSIACLVIEGLKPVPLPVCVHLTKQSHQSSGLLSPYSVSMLKTQLSFLYYLEVPI